MDEESEQIKEVYARYGLAMYQAQCLERGIAIALASVYGPGPKRITRSQFEELLECNFQRTLGSLLTDLRRSIEVPAEFELRLAEALDTRNRLAHRFFWDRAGHFKTARGRALMLTELHRSTELLSQLDDEFQQITLRWFTARGLSPGLIDQYMKELVDAATVESENL